MKIIKRSGTPGYEGLRLEQTTSLPVRRRVIFLRGLAAGLTNQQAQIVNTLN
jgi:hypothetical protein